MRYFIEFSYNGTNYHGWQKQPNAITIEEELTKCLSFQLNENLDLYAAGRTDTGVHAKQMFAHFDIDSKVDCISLVSRLNSFLPNDILVHSIFMVDDKLHARFNALERTYQYFVCNRKEIFNKNIYCILDNLNLERMNHACQFLIGEKDFTSFSKVKTDTLTNNCIIRHAVWEKKKGIYIFTISANRFLRNMVRSIVGTLIDIGKEKILSDTMKEIIEKKDRSFAGMSVPAKALFLKEIKYSDGIKKDNG